MTTSRQAGLPEGVQGQLREELEAERAGLLRQVDGVAAEDALDRMIHGTYGSCTWCDDPITRARLAALPHAALCIDCEQSQEHRR